MLEQGKFYHYDKRVTQIIFECLYADESIAVLKPEMSYSFAIMKNTFDQYKEVIPKLSGSGHLVVLSYKSFDETVRLVKAYHDGNDLKDYLDKMSLMEYKVISVTPVSWEENQ